MSYEIENQSIDPASGTHLSTSKD